MWSDALVSLLIALALLSSALPVCVSTGRILLQSVPLTVKDILDKSLRDVRKAIHSPHCVAWLWRTCSEAQLPQIGPHRGRST
jgi:Co/Zn/Cd efflux system component